MNSEHPKSTDATGGELVIYTDESDKSGRFFSNFYGGVLVRSHDLRPVVDLLETTKRELHLLQEVKWQRVTDNYLDKYRQLMGVFFGLVHADAIKVRIMFTENRFVPRGLTSEQRAMSYHLLYYQFLKHAFGLAFRDEEPRPIDVRLNLDQLPANREDNARFKSFLLGLNQNPQLRNSGIRFRAQQIAEVDSRDHVLLQCLDVVLGAMCFRLNNKHKEKPQGQTRRGRRTIAKETLYKFLKERVQYIHPNFNIGITTGHQGDRSNRWRHSYRHWKFVPSDCEIDPQLGKRK